MKCAFPREKEAPPNLSCFVDLASHDGRMMQLSLMVSAGGLNVSPVLLSDCWRTQPASSPTAVLVSPPRNFERAAACRFRR